MALAVRRVAHARLRAPAPALVRRGAILLEDALRTATFPGGDGPGICFVRRLTLGRIASDGPPSSVALVIGEKLRQLRATPQVPERSVVYFPDAIAPLVQLAQRLVKRHQANEWFWPRAVPGFAPALPPAQQWRAVLTTAARSTAPAAALVEVMRAVAEGAALEEVVALLSPREAAALAVVCGWALPAETPAPADVRRDEPAQQTLPASWHAQLPRMVARWGAEDARVVWVAAVGMAALRTARAGDRRLAVRAARLTRSLARSSRAEKKTVRPEPAPAESRAAREREEPSGALDEDAPVLRDVETTRASPSREATAESAPLAPRRDLLIASSNAASQAPPLPEAQPAGEPGFDVSTPTAFGGLYFLLQSLAALGMRALLDEEPSWAEHALAARVLLALATRLDVPADDPVLAPLHQLVRETETEPEAEAETDTTGAPSLSPFLAPAAWRRVLGVGPLFLRRASRGEGSRELLDQGGLLLGVWWGRAPAGARALVTGHPVCRGPAKAACASAPTDLTSIVQAWADAVTRLCAQLPDLSLEAIVRRPGRIAWTRTHVDLMFPLEAADIAVRMAGLDINPGWLPWLGRVVAFRYEGGAVV